MSTTLKQFNEHIYLSKSGGYPDLVFNDLDDLYCYIARGAGIKIGTKESAYDHLMAHLDALKELNKKTKEEESVSYSVYNKPATVINIDEWEHDFETVHNGLVSIITVNKEFKYRDEADDTIKSIQDSEYIFITSDAMAGAYRRVKCTGYDVNYVTDHNGVELKLTYAN